MQQTMEGVGKMEELMAVANDNAGDVVNVGHCGVVSPLGGSPLAAPGWSCIIHLYAYFVGG